MMFATVVLQYDSVYGSGGEQFRGAGSKYAHLAPHGGYRTLLCVDVMHSSTTVSHDHL